MRSTRSTRRPAQVRTIPVGRGRTASRSGRSLADTPWATRGTCADDVPSCHRRARIGHGGNQRRQSGRRGLGRGLSARQPASRHPRRRGGAGLAQNPGPYRRDVRGGLRPLRRRRRAHRRVESAHCSGHEGAVGSGARCGGGCVVRYAAGLRAAPSPRPVGGGPDIRCARPRCAASLEARAPPSRPRRRDGRGGLRGLGRAASALGHALWAAPAPPDGSVRLRARSRGRHSCPTAAIP